MNNLIKHIFAFGAFLIFLFITAPSIFWGDGGLLISSSFVLGNAHPTGHPLFSLLGKFFTLMPFGSIAFRLNIMAILFCFFSYYLLSILIQELIILIFGDEKGQKGKAFIGNIASFSFLLSAAMIFQARALETYSLNLALSLLAILLFVLTQKKIKENLAERAYPFFFAGAFILGISMGNHSLLAFTVIVPYFAFAKYSLFKIKKFRSIFAGAFFFLVGLSVYLYLPLRAFANPAVNIGDPDNLKNFLWVVTAKQFRESAFSTQGFLSSFNLSIVAMISKSLAKLLYQNMHILLFALFIPGAVISFRKNSRLITIFLILIVLFGIFITIPPTVNTGIPLEERGVVGYFLLPIAILFIFAAMGLKWLVDVLSERVSSRGSKLLLPCFLSLALIIAFLSGIFEIHKEDRNGDYSARIFNDSLFDTMDYGSVFLTSTDAGLYIPLYSQICENTRPDVSIVNRSSVFSKTGLKLLRETDKNLLEYRDVSQAKVFTDELYQKWVNNLSLSYPLYFETGTKDLPDISKLHPNVLIFKYGVGDVYNAKKHFKKTQDLFELLSLSDSVYSEESLHNFSLSLYNIGNFFLKNGKFKEAQYQYSMALKLTPHFLEAGSNLMIAFIAGKDFKKASDTGQRLIKIHKDPGIYYNYALSLIYSSKIKEAKAALEEALTYNNDKRLKELLWRIKKGE